MSEYAITIRPHWAYAIFHLGMDIENRRKDIENKTWVLPRKYECRRIWIHSGMETTKEELAAFCYFLKSIHVAQSFVSPVFANFEDFPRGAIVGSVEFSKKITHRSKWMMSGFHYWAINNAELLPEPIPVKGKVGFWDCTDLIPQN